MTVAITTRHEGHRTVLLALSGKPLGRVTPAGTVTAQLKAGLLLSIALARTGEKTCVEHGKKTCWKRGAEIVSPRNIVFPSVIIEETTSGFLSALANNRGCFHAGYQSK